jgi:hypothetical protein
LRMRLRFNFSLTCSFSDQKASFSYQSKINYLVFDTMEIKISLLNQGLVAVRTEALSFISYILDFDCTLGGLGEEKSSFESS